MKITQRLYWDNRAARYLHVYQPNGSGFNKYLDRVLRKAFYKRLSYTFNFLGDLTGRCVLDAGCGPGVYMVECLRHGAAEVYGVDISKNMMALAAELLTEFSPILGRWNLFNHDLENFKPGKKYDIVLAMGILEYLSCPEKMLKAFAVSSEKLVICTFSRLLSPYSIARRVYLGLKGIKIKLYTRNHIQGLTEKLGLKIKTLKSIGPTYWLALQAENQGA